MTIERISFFEELDCPVLQVPVALCSKEAWLGSLGGLSPAEAAMNVALPEIDGRLFGTVIGFKEEETRLEEIEFTQKRLKPDDSQISYVSDWVRNWTLLRQVPPSKKRLAIILSNYPNRDGRIGNGVGLDTPASTVKMLSSLSAAGYRVEPCPQDGEELMRWLQSGVTNDRERSYGRPRYQEMDREEFEIFLGFIAPETSRGARSELASGFLRITMPVAGIQLGDIFVGIQPPRGYSLQPQAIYHSPTLPPPPEYLAFYLWIRETFRAHAIIHLGKHGNLEWLPGRSVALGQDDYPQLCLGPLPHFYPFIVNNPGEGSQAKRRTAAVIVDHLTPPLTRAGLYGDLEKVERLLEEHAHCLSLYPSRAIELEREISQTLEHSSWRADLPSGTKSVEAIGSFLCDIKESQIRSALHVLGERPTGEREIDFLLSLVRIPSGDRPSLLEALNSVEVDDLCRWTIRRKSFCNASLDDLTSAERDALEAKARTWLSDVLKSAKGPPRRTEAEREKRAFGGESNQELEVHSAPERDLTRLRAFVLRPGDPEIVTM